MTIDLLRPHPGDKMHPKTGSINEEGDSAVVCRRAMPPKGSGVTLYMIAL